METLIWQITPSLTPDFERNYRATNPQGDQISMDLNPRKKLVQIHLYLSKEPKKEYRSILKSGQIIQQRENISKENIDIQKLLVPFTSYFGLLQDIELLKALGSNFNISPSHQKISLTKQKPKIYDFHLKKNIWEQFKHYLQRKKDKEDSISTSYWKHLLIRLPSECWDLFLGLFCLQLIINLNSLSYGSLALAIGIYGVFCGLLDCLVRARSPFLPKILFFLCISASLVYTQIQYRMWAIYL